MIVENVAKLAGLNHQILIMSNANNFAGSPSYKTEDWVKRIVRTTQSSLASRQLVLAE